jgi:hypothetical protein
LPFVMAPYNPSSQPDVVLPKRMPPAMAEIPPGSNSSSPALISNLSICPVLAPQT